MVKKAFLLLGLLLLIRPIIPLVDYVVNYDYISKVLCENKAKPELKCNGKCHLMKEMAKASEEEKPLQNDKKIVHLESEVLFFQEIERFILQSNNYPNLIENTFIYSNSYSHLSSFSIFHPPIFLS